MKALAVLLVAACVPESTPTPPVARWITDTSTLAPSAPPSASLAAHYREIGGKIVATAHADRGAYRKLAELTDHIGNRISGSPQLERAIAWAVQTMKDEGFAVHTEKVMVPHWVRGAEDAELITPIARPLHLIGLGYSPATPRGGITAPIVVVHDWAELATKRDAVAGAIVLYDVPMTYSKEAGPSYGTTVEYRSQGAKRAAKLGAVAILMRSVTAHSLRTPHTGSVSYDADQPKIPAAAVTVEDATLLARLAAAGPVTVHLHLESQMLPDAESANVIGELRGTDKPDEVVVIGGHIDSWDVGQGAHDDGAGCVIMMQAISVLSQLKLVPHRTIRVVLFTNEENGLRGAKAYANDHAGELGKTVLAIESDSGGFAPLGFGVNTKADTTTLLAARVREIASLLAPIHATRVAAGHGEADISPMGPAGVPLIGLDVDNPTYFDIHHTDADTLDKVDPQQLADDVAAVALLAYVAADVPGRLDSP